uniref:Uncharacterized protein n=1 Tax=Heterorhabditis bacteriophora TaxID=37862 RepID=A0A1I7XEE7_HETBA
MQLNRHEDDLHITCAGRASGPPVDCVRYNDADSGDGSNGSEHLLDLRSSIDNKKRVNLVDDDNIRSAPSLPV